ncbi:MAG TPA: hypothetical protein VEC16_00180, partial [Alphaproteobacteria bacterium]|nr:hypothetical protein [Alphaproteobacteria bacterium]
MTQSSYLVNNKTSLVDKLKTHISDSTALNVESAPVMAAFEVGLLGFSNFASLNSRLFSLGLTYAGTGSLFTQGRDYSRKKFGINDETSEKARGIHDVAYTGAFNFGFNMFVYSISHFVAGENIEGIELIKDSGISAILGATNGWPMNYCVDMFRDLAGIKEC